MDHAKCATEHLLLFLPRVDASASHKTVTPGRIKLFDEKWSVSTWAASCMDLEDHIFASCNGLLCFYRKYTLKIVNPTTGQCLHLSKPEGKLFPDLYCMYSFGFHPATGEYKLIYFHREPRPRYGRLLLSAQPFCFDSIQVYTLGEDRWREITAPKQSCLVNLGVVNVDGAMYWIAEEEAGACCGVAVMRFDLKEETFVSLRSPPLKACEATDGPCDAAGLSYYVTEVDGKVCLVTVPFSCSAPRWHRYNAEVDGRMDVWMLESPAEDRWFLRYSIDLHRWLRGSFRSRASSAGRRSCCTIATATPSAETWMDAMVLWRLRTAVR
jgi:F-box interacting protein